MTHQRGGGVLHAWLLTKHEMFMLSVHGSGCVEKNMHHPPTKDVDMEQDTIGQDINISPAPFLPPSFSHPLSSLPHGVGLPPG